MTAHFLVGAVVAARLPAAHRRCGAARTTVGGAAALAVGLVGWADAKAPWRLFVASIMTGVGWGALGAAALNAFVTPWFDRKRPAALGFAYNGASAGGIVFPPLWVAATGVFGFVEACAVIGSLAFVVVYGLVGRVLRRNPTQMNVRPDGEESREAGSRSPSQSRQTAWRPTPWRDRRFATLCAGMALGLFAQIGLTAHLFSLLVPVLGARHAALSMSLIALMAIAGVCFLCGRARADQPRGRKPNTRSKRFT